MEAKASTIRSGSSEMGLRRCNQISDGFSWRDQIGGAVGRGLDLGFPVIALFVLWLGLGISDENE